MIENIKNRTKMILSFQLTNNVVELCNSVEDSRRHYLMLTCSVTITMVTSKIHCFLHCGAKKLSWEHSVLKEDDHDLQSAAELNRSEYLILAVLIVEYESFPEKPSTNKKNVRNVPSSYLSSTFIRVSQ